MNNLSDHEIACHIGISQFIQSFTALESWLRKIILQESSLDEQHFGILIGFPRTNEALKMARDLFRLHGFDSEVQAWIGRAFDQIDAIARLRNNIVHYGAAPIDGDRIAIWGKPQSVLDTDDEDHDEISLDDLRLCSSDINGIRKTFFLILRPAPKEKRSEVRASILTSAPWQYKPPSQRRGRI